MLNREANVRSHHWFKDNTEWINLAKTELDISNG